MFDYHFLFLGGALMLIGLQGVLGAMLVRDVAKDRVLRPNRVVSTLARWLTLRRGFALAALFFCLGLVFDSVVLYVWIRGHFGALLETRRAVMGLLCMAVGAELAIFAFLHAALRRHA